MGTMTFGGGFFGKYTEVGFALTVSPGAVSMVTVVIPPYARSVQIPATPIVLV